MDKMREEFEAWAMSCDMCTYFDDAEYRHQSTEWAWRAWKASRAALCVELPETIDDESGSFADIFYITKSLDDAGVSYK